MTRILIIAATGGALVVGAAVFMAPLSRPPAPPSAKAAPQLTASFAVPVLMYHRISPLTEKEARSPLVRDLTVSPQDFEEQVSYLSRNGFTFLLASEVEDAISRGLPLPERSVALTMDDGYKDNFEHAFPILQKYGARATIFLVTSTVDTPRHLSWQDTLTMKGRVSYGSHTVHHFELTTLNRDDLDFEVRESKAILESRLSIPITGLAYPAGSFNDTVANATEQAGYIGAWKKGGGSVQPDAEPFRLPRVRVHGRTDLAKFKRIVWSGVYAIRERQAQLAQLTNRASHQQLRS